MADIIVGGPPCQGFSTAGARIRHGFIDDPRNYLFKHYFNIVKLVKPKIFIFENVKGIISYDKGRVFAEIRNAFESLGYKLQYTIAKAKDIIFSMLSERPLLYPKIMHIRKHKPIITSTTIPILFLTVFLLYISHLHRLIQILLMFHNHIFHTNTNGFQYPT